MTDNKENKEMQYGGLFGILIREENPQWPPKIGSTIVACNPNYKELFIGRVLDNVWNKTASVMVLLNNRNYVETALISQTVIPGNHQGKGLFLLLPTYAWKYVDKKTFQTLMKAKSPGLVRLVNDDIQKSYQEFRGKLATDKLLENEKTCAQMPSSISCEKQPTTQQDITQESIYKTAEKCEATQEPSKCDTNDSYKDTSLLTNKGELDFDSLFGEKEVNKLLYNSREEFNAPKSWVMELLHKKLQIPQNIEEEEKKILVNKSVAVNNMITTKEDEINEGKKIVKWIIDHMMNVKTDDMHIFGDMKLYIFNGYVHIARKGIRVDDIITTRLIPNLTYYKWQYGIPIDYDSLKYTLFQNNFQQSIKSNVGQQKEAEKILSQEYLICMQPQPKYQIWCLKRLIMCWYANIDLQNNIRKIKVLINQWRGLPDKDFNNKYGILPSIVIYPRYGKTSARIVLSRLADYFLLYQNIGWECSKPSYFIKVNDLVWYTNGAIDLKIYFKKTKDEYQGVVNEASFNEKYTMLRNAMPILYPFKQ